MNFEKFRLAGSEEVYKETDPTTYSPVIPEGGLTATGKEIPNKRYPIYEDGVSEYVRLKEDGPRQEVVARLLKGVINVADVVSVPVERGREYFSKIMPHDQIDASSSEVDIRADLEVISLVFNDQDRNFRMPHEYGGAFEHNLRQEGGKVSHFDFGEAELNIDAPFRGSVRYDSTMLLQKTREKLDALKEKFSGDEGRAHFLSIIAASGKHPAKLFPYSGASGSPEVLYEGFISRIDRAIAFVSHYHDNLAREAA